MSVPDNADGNADDNVNDNDTINFVPMTMWLSRCSHAYLASFFLKTASSCLLFALVILSTIKTCVDFSPHSRRPDLFTTTVRGNCVPVLIIKYGNDRDNDQ